MDSARFVRNWLVRFRKVTSLLPAKTSAAVLPESRHRRLSKHWEFSASLQNLLQEFSSETPLTTGFLLIEQPDLHDDIKEGDTVTVVMNEHVDYNGKQYPIASLPENLMSIIQAGGLVKAMRKLNGLD